MTLEAIAACPIPGWMMSTSSDGDAHGGTRHARARAGAGGSGRAGTVAWAAHAWPCPGAVAVKGRSIEAGSQGTLFFFYLGKLVSIRHHVQASRQRLDLGQKRGLGS